MDQPTDRPTDRRTDIASYRDAYDASKKFKLLAKNEEKKLFTEIMDYLKIEKSRESKNIVFDPLKICLYDAIN